jgi:signal transduction histidine kinase
MNRGLKLYIGFEVVLVMAIIYELGVLFKPQRQVYDFNIIIAVLPMILLMMLWSAGFWMKQREYFNKAKIGLKDALNSEKLICYVFNQKGLLVQHSLGPLLDVSGFNQISCEEDLQTSIKVHCYSGTEWSSHSELVIIDREEQSFIYGFSRENVLTPRGDIIGCIWSASDQTELQRLYEDLSMKQAELKEIQNYLGSYLEVVEDLERMQSQKDIARKMNETIGQELMTLLKLLQIMNQPTALMDEIKFREQLDLAIGQCREIIGGVRETVRSMTERGEIDQ